MDQIVAAPENADRSRQFNRYIDPQFQYVDFMSNQDDTRRRAVHAKIAMDTLDLVRRIEARRSLLAGDTVDLRRRAYSAQLFLDHQDQMISVLRRLGHTIGQMRELGPKAVIGFVQNVATLNVEAEMAARLEAKTGSIRPNDVMDMQSFYTAIPYSLRIIAEKAFVSLAKQAKLDLRYQTLMSHSLLDLQDVYK